MRRNNIQSWHNKQSCSRHVAIGGTSRHLRANVQRKDEEYIDNSLMASAIGSASIYYCDIPVNDLSKN